MQNYTMQNYVEYALEKLQKADFKLTNPRQMIVKLLASSEKALTPYEMRDLLKKQKIKGDVVTIYRVLEVLEKLSLAHKVLAIGGYIRCSTKDLEKVSARPSQDQSQNSKRKTFGSVGAKRSKKEALCHHYLLCQNCHHVEEVEGEDLTKLEQKIFKDHQFKIESHYLEFMGLCVVCQRKASK